MSDVIGFADFIEHRVLETNPTMAARRQHQQTGFTLRDREDLDEWSSDDHRVSICSSDMGPFALLYQAGRPWASWGVVRQGRSVLLWDCVTHADIGQFPSMTDALAAVRVNEFRTPVANIIHFTTARPRTVRIG